MTFLADTPQQLIGQFHSLFFNFPIVLFTGALVTDLLNYFGKSRAFTAGHWLIIAGVVMCVPTIITGLSAAESFDANDYILAKHRSLGYATGISGSLYAGLRISAMCWKLPLLPAHYLGLSLLLVALTSWTSDYGALIGKLPTEQELPIKAHDAVTNQAVSLQSDPFFVGLDAFDGRKLMQDEALA